MDRRSIKTVFGKAEAVANHGADQGAFDVADGECHGESAQDASPPLQSRRAQGGKRGSATVAALAAILVPAFCTATWQHRVTLGIVSASALLWLVPIQPLWWSSQASPARRTVADIVLLTGCWMLATWALWQHRMLPLAVCAVAGALVLLDVVSRPTPSLPVCVPERTPRRRVINDPNL